MRQQRRVGSEARPRPQPRGDAVMMHLHDEPDVEPRMKRRARQARVQLAQRRIELRRRHMRKDVHVFVVEPEALLQLDDSRRRRRCRQPRRQRDVERRAALGQRARHIRLVLGDGERALEPQPHPRADGLQILGVVGERRRVRPHAVHHYEVLLVCVTPCGCS